MVKNLSILYLKCTTLDIHYETPYMYIWSMSLHKILHKIYHINNQYLAILVGNICILKFFPVLHKNLILPLSYYYYIIKIFKIEIVKPIYWRYYLLGFTCMLIV